MCTDSSRMALKTEDVKPDLSHVKEDSSLGDVNSLLRDSPHDSLFLQVFGLGGYVPFLRFHEAFMRNFGIVLPACQVIMEDNCVPNKDGVLVKTSEFFIQVPDAAAASAVSKIEYIEVFLTPDFRSSRVVSLRKPNFNVDSRTAYRKVFELQKRLPVIEKEYASIGAVRESPNDKPVLPGLYRDKEWFMQEENFPAISRKRKTGTPLNAHDLYVLKRVRLVETKPLQARIDALFEEESEAWFTMRMYQLAGLSFQFHE